MRKFFAWVVLILLAKAPAIGHYLLMSNALHNGSHSSDNTVRLGMCWTDDESVAAAYACGGSVVTISESVLADLVVVEAPAYDRAENFAQGDDAATLAAWGAVADVITYDDEDERGRSHRTWRLVSDRAVAAVAALFS